MTENHGVPGSNPGPATQESPANGGKTRGVLAVSPEPFVNGVSTAGSKKASFSTTVVNSMAVWHDVLSYEGGCYDADGGSEDGEFVDRGVGGGKRTPLGALHSFRGSSTGMRLPARFALQGRAKKRLAVGRGCGQRHALRHPAFAGAGQLGRRCPKGRLEGLRHRASGRGGERSH